MKIGPTTQQPIDPNAPYIQYQGRPNDLMQPIGGLTQPQQLQALQAGVGAPALGGPTQQKIQQGIGALV